MGRENKIILLENENERCLHFTYCHTLQQEAGHHEIQQVSVPAGELNAMKEATSDEMSQLGSSGRLSILLPSSANAREQPRHPQAGGEELSQRCGRASVAPRADALRGEFCVVLGHLFPLLAFGSCSSLGPGYSYKTSSGLLCLFQRWEGRRSEMCAPSPRGGRRVGQCRDATAACVVGA